MGSLFAKKRQLTEFDEIVIINGRGTVSPLQIVEGQVVAFIACVAGK